MSDKPDYTLLPSCFLGAVAKVRASGDCKYGPIETTPPRSARAMIAAILRHCYEYLDGVDADHESGESPLAHVAARVAVMMYQMKSGVLIDDRALPKSKRTATSIAGVVTFVHDDAYSDKGGVAVFGVSDPIYFNPLKWTPRIAQRIEYEKRADGSLWIVQ